jgi:hypothetical protein
VSDLQNVAPAYPAKKNGRQRHKRDQLQKRKKLFLHNPSSGIIPQTYMRDADFM